MKINHVLILCVIFTIILVALSACQAVIETRTITATGPTTIVTTTTGIPWLDIPTYNQFVENITAGVGEEFAIALFPQPRVGLNWYPTYDDNLLVLLGSGHGIHATVGEDIDTEDQYFIFMALKKGSTEITLVYKHSAPEAEVVEEKTFTVDIQ